MKERSAGLVLVRDSKVLALHYAAGHWDLPKGHIEKGESEETAALRELEEETGITDAEILPKFREVIHYVFHRGKKLVSKDVVFFIGKTSEDKVTLSFEHQGHAWLPFDEAVEKMTFKTAKEVIEKAHGFLKNQ